MVGEELSSFALQRVTAYEGLAIDAATWTDAHTYHQTAQRLHTRVLHGWGIVTGLEVHASTPANRSVILQPGVAIDYDGNVIRVPQPVRVNVQQPATGTVCFVLRFVESPVETGNGVPPSRMSEFFNLLASPLPLRPGDIEVARVEVPAATTAFTTATSDLEPGPGEIDTRFRRQLRVPAGETVTIGQLVLSEGTTPGAHREGLRNVLRELHASAPFVPQYMGDLRPEQAVGNCDILYVTGAGSVRLTPKEGAQLLAYVRGGGVVFAEPCVELETQRQENGRFIATFQRLLADLKQEMSPLERGHPLFHARHVFGAPPEGLGGHAPLVGKGNIILNPNDYGCCWQGGTPGKPLPRESIRSAIELGTNVAWLAADPAARRARMATGQTQPAERAG